MLYDPSPTPETKIDTHVNAVVRSILRRIGRPGLAVTQVQEELKEPSNLQITLAFELLTFRTLKLKS